MKKTWAMCLAACMLLTACGGGAAEETAAAGGAASSETAGTEASANIKDEIIFCQGNDLTTLDATIGQQERAYSISNNMFDPLLTRDSDMKMQPCLATEYEWADDTTLKLTLREGVKFHDGSDMTAEDVKFTLDLIDERGALFVGNYDSCTIDDDYHVTVKLNSPNPAFLSTLTLPQAAVVPAEYDEATFGENPIGTGPYKLKEAVEGDYYTVERFDDYWGEPAKTQYLTMKIVPEAAQRTMMLETGEVDVAYEIPNNDISRIQENEDLQLLTCPSMKIILMELNCSSDGPIGDPNVRKAVECAIDKQTIVDSLLYGYGTVSSNIVPQAAEDYREYETNSYDPEKAKSLLAEAGYGDGFELTLWTNSNQTNTEIAQVMQSQLAEVGITLNIVTQDDNTSFSLIEAGEDFDLMLDFWQTNSGHADYVFNGMLLSSSVNNFSRYFNDEFDATYVEYASTGEGEEREALLKELYDDLVRDTPIIGLYSETKVVAATADLHDLILSQIGAHEYQNAYITEE